MQMTKTNELKALHLKCVRNLETWLVEIAVNRGLTVLESMAVWLSENCKELQQINLNYMKSICLMKNPPI